MMIKTQVFCGSQMRKARILNNFTLKDLSDRTKIDIEKLFEFERGLVLPQQDEEVILAKSLLVEPKFFYQTDTSPITEDECTFSPRMRS